MTNDREKYTYFSCYIRQDKRHITHIENTMTQPVQNRVVLIISLEDITDGTNPFYNTPGVPY